MSRFARYKEVVRELKLAKDNAEQNLTLEELSSSLQPSLCDALKSFVVESDEKYLELFESASNCHAQGWPQSSVKQQAVPLY